MEFRAIQQLETSDGTMGGGNARDPSSRFKKRPVHTATMSSQHHKYKVPDPRSNNNNKPTVVQRVVPYETHQEFTDKTTTASIGNSCD